MVRAVSIWFWLSYLALATMAAVLSFIVTAQQRKFSHLESEFLRSRDPVPVDAALRLDRELPALTGLRGDYGSESSWEEFFDERSGVLLVLNAACAPCRYLADELNAPAAESILRRAVLVVEGTESETRTLIAGSGLKAARTLQVSPGAVNSWLGGTISPLLGVIEQGRLVRAVQVHSLDQVRRFLARVDSLDPAGVSA